MTKKKAVLIVCGGAMQVPVIRIAQYLGYFVINTDGNSKCPGSRAADEFREMSTYDVSGHVALAAELAEEYDLRGIFTAGADVEHVVAMAAVAARCPGVDPRAAYITHYKPKFRQVLDMAGLPNVQWAEVGNEQELFIAAHRIGYPLVVKNVDGCASRGVTLVREKNIQNLIDAFGRACAASSTGTALIEEMLTGPEQTVETLMEGRRQHKCFITDRFFLDKGKGDKTGHCIESGMRNPSTLDWQTRDLMYEYARAAAIACGVDFGAFKCDMMLTKDGPRIIEATLRLSGGFDCTHLVPAATGQEIVKAALLQACGEGVHTELLKVKTHDNWAVSLNKFPKPGRITEIRIPKQPYKVKHMILRYDVGDVIPPYVDCAARPAWLIATGSTPDWAYNNAKNALDLIKIRTEPVDA